jgi:hypothetical protein
MRIRPFLSHKRENARAVARLKQTLQLFGAGGWKDTDDLRLGASTEEELRRVIALETGGFLWWGTQAALDSWMINNVEIPAAFERASAEPRYPLVPVFVDLSPGKNRNEIVLRSVGDYAERLLNRNGVVRGGSETAEAFRRRVAGRYVRDAVRSLPEGRLSVAFRALSEPAGGHDLTFDWRSVLGARSRRLEGGALPVLVEALSNAREALQAREGSPEVQLDADLPLPLAFLVGHEWRATSRVRLQIWQRTGSSYAWVEAEGPTCPPPKPVTERLRRDGPAVLVVSCGDPIDGVAARYAAEHSASELVTLHASGLLDPDGMRSLARKAASQLRALNDRGLPKHLLIKGPAAVATLAGAASNACGPVTVPFWDGTAYVSPITVGP